MHGSENVKKINELVTVYLFKFKFNYLVTNLLQFTINI
jgi:hypothetical protein